MSQKVVTIDPELCTGCGQCAMACSFKHEGVYSPRLSRIKLVRFEEKCLSVPVTCAYCEEAVCEEICPMGAMTHVPDTGAAKVLNHLCIGCKECANACPLGAIDIHPKEKVALRCDLCDGEPQCVVNCPTGALKYEDLYLATRDKRRKRVLGLKIE